MIASINLGTCSQREKAIAEVEVLALRVLAENIEEDGQPAEAIEIRLAAG